MSLDENWLFAKDREERGAVQSLKMLKWTELSLPHTWNRHDVMDDTPGYYRGVGWYKKALKFDSEGKSKKIFLYFDGANQETTVFVNGKEAGYHAGGYTRFVIPISDFLNFNGSSNEILVKVNNRYNADIPPLSADFTFYGGIYRHLYLLITEPVSFDAGESASSGVFVYTPEVSDKNASVVIRSYLCNSLARASKIIVRTRITDAAGNRLSEIESVVKLKEKQKIQILQQIRSLKNPHLWSPKDPYLYRVVSRLYDARTKKLLDEVINPLGFRWFKFDAQKGFFLNGKPLKLIGTSRHQDFKGMGNALPAAIQIEDMKLIKEMGGNFLRIAHYPQDPLVLSMCDQLGILASVEIPIVNAITESERFYNHCSDMQREMIRQNFNHPSVIMWGYMNEVLLKPAFENDKARQRQYFNNITRLAQNLETLTRKEDPGRYTFIANHGAYGSYKKLGLTSIPMVVGWNLYQGWYSDKIEGFGEFLDLFHRENPEKPLFITEYGADADPRLRGFDVSRFDKTVEYATYYHQVYLSEIFKRPFVVGATAWNLADFNSEQREETMPHINNKGLLTWDRRPKDPYYYYQASLLTRPFIKIASSQWTLRSGPAEVNGAFCRQPLEVFTNLKRVRLLRNGEDLGIKEAINHTCKWMVPFINGTNCLEAIAVGDSLSATDFVKVDFRLLPYNLADSVIPFKSLSVLLGSRRYYFDEEKHEIWLPDQPYRKGSWGFVGGKPFSSNGWNKDTYGTDKNITGTFDDPIFQTQRVGLNEFRMDVPNGMYEVSLYFAELTGGKTTAPLLYNLTNKVQHRGGAQRAFNVSINGKTIVKFFNLAQEAFINHGIIKTAKVFVEDGNGISVAFTPVEDEPVLNAIQVRKLF